MVLFDEEDVFGPGDRITKAIYVKARAASHCQLGAASYEDYFEECRNAAVFLLQTSVSFLFFGKDRRVKA